MKGNFLRKGQHRKVVLSLIALLGLTVALAIAACAPQQTTLDKGGNNSGADSEISIPTWSLESDCLSCHSLEASSVDDASTLYGFHTSADTEQSCISCHNEEELLVKVHEKKSGATSSTAKTLTKTQVSSEQCLDCHDLDEIATATTEVSALTDAKGKVVNPHQLPQSSDHGTIECSDCHKMHSEKSLLSETAMEACVDCHHEKVFECGTCH